MIWGATDYVEIRRIFVSRCSTGIPPSTFLPFPIGARLRHPLRETSIERCPVDTSDALGRQLCFGRGWPSSSCTGSAVAAVCSAPQEIKTRRLGESVQGATGKGGGNRERPLHANTTLQDDRENKTKTRDGGSPNAS